MKPSIKTSKPAAVTVTVPYGHPSLVAATQKLLEQNILSDVTDLIEDLDAQHSLTSPDPSRWAPVLNHTGWVDPGESMGLLDFNFAFDGDDLTKLRIELLAYNIVGGNGEPLVAGDDRLVRMFMKIHPKSWGEELFIEHLDAANDDWLSFARGAAETMKRYWKQAAAKGETQSLTSTLGREPFLKGFLAAFWDAEHLKVVVENHALELILLDDDQEAAEHASSLEHQANQIHLVTPWLAEQLEKRGAVARVVAGLPLWSRDNFDAPHLEEVAQRVAYEHSQSDTTDLASTPQ